MEGDDNTMLKTLLQENKPFSKEDELQDLFGAGEKVHQCLFWFDVCFFIPILSLPDTVDNC